MGENRRSFIDEFRRSWKTCLVAALVAVLLGASTGVGYLQVRFLGVQGTPTETVRRYLTALAANDSLTALQELADPPADRTLLTDEVLRASHLDAPITDLTVEVTTSTRVPVRFMVGTQRVETVFTVRAEHSRFKVAGGLTKADLTQARSYGVPVLVGGKATTTDVVTLFPGVYPISSGDPRLSFTPGGSVSATDLNGTALFAEQSLSLTDTGLAEIRTVVGASLDACVRETVTEPKGCPFSDPGTYAPGSARWTVLSQSEVTADLTDDVAVVSVTSRLRLTAISAADGKPVSKEIPLDATGTVDVLAESWQIEWK